MECGHMPVFHFVLHSLDNRLEIHRRRGCTIFKTAALSDGEAVYAMLQEIDKTKMILETWYRA